MTLKRFYINWSNQTESFDDEGWAVYADEALMAIAELEAHIEDRARRIAELQSTIIRHTNAASLYVKRIAQLERQLSHTRCDACGDMKQCHDVGDVHICNDCHVAYVLSSDVADATSALNARIAELEAALDVRGSGTMALLERRGKQVEELTSDVIRLNRENDELQATNEQLLARLYAALTTGEAAAQPEETSGWIDKQGTYTATESSQLGTWGVEDNYGAILYEADMFQEQAEALAQAHNAGVTGFDEALEWLQARGIDWGKLETAEGCAP